MPLGDSKKARTALNCCSVHKHTQQLKPSPQSLAVAWRQSSSSPGRTPTHQRSARESPPRSGSRGGPRFPLSGRGDRFWSSLFILGYLNRSSFPGTTLPWETLPGAIVPDNTTPRVTGAHTQSRPPFCDKVAILGGEMFASYLIFYVIQSCNAIGCAFQNGMRKVFSLSCWIFGIFRM